MKASIKHQLFGSLLFSGIPTMAAAQNPPSCPALGAPVSAIQGTTYYAKSDASRSKIDDNQLRLNQKLSKPVNDFLDAISDLSDQYVLAPTEATKRCSDQIFFEWAKANALLDVKAGAQSRFIQQWASSTLGIARMKLGPLRSQQQDAVVSMWMRKIAWSVNSFQQGDGGTGRQNHYYWAMLGIGATGLSTGDRKLWQRSEEMFKIAINDIQTDGTLPAELKRGQRAGLYHAFAAQPLAVHTLMREKCVSPASSEPPQLEKLLNVVRGEIGGSRTIDDIAGTRQTHVGKQHWLMLWDAVQKDLPQSAGTMKSRNLAGRMDTLATVIGNNCKSTG